MATTVKLSSPARSGPADHKAAAAMLPQQQKVFEQYQNARLNSQGRVHPQTTMLRLSSDPKSQLSSGLGKTQFFQGFDTQAQEIYYFKMIERTFELLIE